ncbi:hypothetical protein B0T21DRAFT_197602 [Apiosordaria backusii]|uniref:Uncharacterized protein n=1 Tax=Apiosordaria backusii TaxID=314023 RepID=A0AA40BE50_9PEZI|nr:hypothetical protein B0T21DRAFT_197602 [Apiosordaria backusii]
MRGLHDAPQPSSTWPFPPSQPKGPRPDWRTSISFPAASTLQQCCVPLRTFFWHHHHHDSNCLAILPPESRLIGRHPHLLQLFELSAFLSLAFRHLTDQHSGTDFQQLSAHCNTTTTFGNYYYRHFNQRVFLFFLPNYYRDTTCKDFQMLRNEFLSHTQQTLGLLEGFYTTVPPPPLLRIKGAFLGNGAHEFLSIGRRYPPQWKGRKGRKGNEKEGE